jgi:hypothetical protein
MESQGETKMPNFLPFSAGSPQLSLSLSPLPFPSLPFLFSRLTERRQKCHELVALARRARGPPPGPASPVPEHGQYRPRPSSVSFLFIPFSLSLSLSRSLSFRSSIRRPLPPLTTNLACGFWLRGRHSLVASIMFLTYKTRGRRRNSRTQASLSHPSNMRI